MFLIDSFSSALAAVLNTFTFTVYISDRIASVSMHFVGLLFPYLCKCSQLMFITCYFLVEMETKRLEGKVTKGKVG